MKSWQGISHYSIGYRQMIRWYAIGVWDWLDEHRFEWVMRLDDDSLLHSRIP